MQLWLSGLDSGFNLICSVSDLADEEKKISFRMTNIKGFCTQAADLD